MKKLIAAVLLLSCIICSQANAEMLTVNSNGDIVTSQVLESGIDYIVEVSGTFVFGDFTAYADAEYYMKGSSRTWDEISEYYPDDESRLDLLVNGQDQNWLGTTDGIDFYDDIFSESHIYRLYLTGAGEALQFQLYDTVYTDNSGSFQVEITQAPVPEPATFLLLGSGLIGLAGIRKRKAKK